jgi:methylenetetrahydrofolate reductase (NADH)
MGGCCPAPGWLIGAVENPFSPRPSSGPASWPNKVAAGAEFVQTQFIFDLGIFERFMADVRDLEIDHQCGVMAGVGPVQSPRALEYISTKVPGIHVPEAMVRRLRGVPAERVADEGRQICVEIIQRIHRALGIFPTDKLIIPRLWAAPPSRSCCQIEAVSDGRRNRGGPPSPAGTDRRARSMIR